MDELKQLQIDIGMWSDETFGPPNERFVGILEHLKKEVDEIIEDPYDAMEFADCMMLLLDAARIAGLDPSDLLKMMQKKLEINKQREWGPVDDSGVCEHIRPTIPLVRLKNS